MDELLRELGVKKDVEEDILERVFGEAAASAGGDGTEPTQEISGKKRTRLGGGIIANSIIENVDFADHLPSSNSFPSSRKTTQTIDFFDPNNRPPSSSSSSSRPMYITNPNSEVEFWQRRQVHTVDIIPTKEDLYDKELHKEEKSYKKKRMDSALSEVLLKAAYDKRISMEKLQMESLRRDEEQLQRQIHPHDRDQYVTEDQVDDGSKSNAIFKRLFHSETPHVDGDVMDSEGFSAPSIATASSVPSMGAVSTADVATINEKQEDIAMVTNEKPSFVPYKITCPDCRKGLRVIARDIDATLAQHLARCSVNDPSPTPPASLANNVNNTVVDLSESPKVRERQRSRRRAQPRHSLREDSDEEGMVIAGSDDDDYVPTQMESDDEDRREEETLVQESRVRNRTSAVSTSANRRAKKTLVQKTPSRTTNTNKSTQPAVPVMVDDWEDDDFVARLQELTPAQKEVVETDYNTYVPRLTWEGLFPYQQEGVKWLYGLYREGMGGILADEMGLGKTAQFCTHLASLSAMGRMFDKSRSMAYLIVCPVTVLRHWLDEIHRWAPLVRAVVLHPVSKAGKEINSLAEEDIERVIRQLRKSRFSRTVAVIVSYEALRKHRASLSVIDWTSIALDEGQKIRNPEAEITMIAKDLPSFHRVILSGTPIQNNLRELWSLFDFIYPGRLGSQTVFETEFAEPIRQGGYANASRLHYQVAIRTAAMLQSIVKPYLLRRKKADQAIIAQLPNKTEQILFCQMSDYQRTIYRHIIESDEVRSVIARRFPAFRAIMTLRKLCNHPALVYSNGQILWSSDKERAAEKRKAKKTAIDNLDDEDVKNELPSDDDDEIQRMLSTTSAGGIEWSDSGKLLVLSKLLPLWKTEGHRVLIFSQTRGMLNILETMVRAMNFSYLRLDGNTPISRRPQIIESYNSDPNIFVMLLTTRTGGVGISLTAANRVVLFDPDWNPMTDIQARERAWRLGQKREVCVYRLVTKGSIEEKIYQRQIFKLLLSNRVLDNARQKGLFSRTQIRELFELPEDDTNDNTVTSLPTNAIVQLDNIKMETSTYDGGNEEDGGENNGKDRELLKALFDGDAITEVYDHHVLEPTRKAELQARSATIEEAAAESVKSSLRALENSAPTVFGFPPLLPSQPASEISFNDFSSSFGGGSSADLLSAIRSQNTDVETSVEKNLSAPLPSFTSSNVPETKVLPKRLPPTITQAEISIRDRILALFAKSPSGKLTTQQILFHFGSVGEKYGPLFRKILRDLASVTSSVWTLKSDIHSNP